MSYADGTPDYRDDDRPDDTDHDVCACCARDICLHGAACFSFACPGRAGRRVGPPDATLCARCADEWETEERALRAVANVLGAVRL